MTEKDVNGRYVCSDPMSKAIINYRQQRPGARTMRMLLDIDAAARREEAKNGT
jgi:hypothetical protein